MTAVNGIPWWYNFRSVNGTDPGPLRAIDPEGWLWSELGAARAIGCVVKVGGSTASPGVTVNGGAGSLQFGEPNDSPASERLTALLALFDSPEESPIELTVSAVPNIRNAVWDKLVFNVVGNVVSTLTQSTNADVASDPQLRKIAGNMVTEVAAICAGLSPPVELTTDTAVFLNGMAGGGDHLASTLQDLLAGQPFEKDAIVTAVQEIAAAAGVETPFIDMAGGLLQALERNAVLAKL